MCGIIGILGNEPAAPRLIEALRRLEYRGYDSAGIAALSATGALERVRAPGKLKNLEAELETTPLQGTQGIGHTRWATHGSPTVGNAHPHVSGKVAVVHNGIIENFRDLRQMLEGKGHKFETQTDTETIAHLIAANMQEGMSEVEAVKAGLSKLEGAFALAFLFEDKPDLMIGARKGSPLAIGVGDGEMYLGSDALAVAPFTNRVIYLEEGDWCVLHRESYEIFDAKGHPVERPVTIVQGAGAAAEKGNYRHFMQKEIFEQPDSTARTIGAYLNVLNQTVTLPEENGEAIDWKEITSLQMVACGTAHYATRVAEYWFEQVAGIPVKTDIASEFRYRDPALPRTGGLAIFVSQSGETADTLAALRYCKAQGLKTAAVVNVPTSTIAREADLVLPTLAGPEIGVASTKAFTAQLSALAAVAISAGRAREMLSRDAEIRLVRALTELPRLISTTLALDERIEALARDIAKATDVIYLGRGVHYPIALEGALKLKEISYIHAEGYASGELKHGPIALIDEETPVVFVAPFDGLFDKSLSNLQEVAARRGEVILISDEAGLRAAGEAPAHRIELPDCDPFIAPILYSIPVQLLAYHVAVEKGTDVDQPRNLAKSVTVE
ncbi:glutamine--fructose-6-phosphate transaminase (isomerizing) [Henriciella mobilis]|uniref:glutamine--fructose-6-phosphate transaminase (isomerizing) n=1 Tax=Henriciella mobilis TaxID=2305467 RepID=UPI000E664051|nr:glutamine--fructose-6-phosphate transaminase (isomerizing) [Henriciella mobilis]RIJ18027.1 glutamine--fructose-6-phosphate transaminase (isomerizing) [Henriciella mobilis]RIJ25164.1 glutamine--fructose-6-phosphate transaminase (isomerizing) [Henriciella mobilis]